MASNRRKRSGGTIAAHPRQWCRRRQGKKALWHNSHFEASLCQDLGPINVELDDALPLELASPALSKLSANQRELPILALDKDSRASPRAGDSMSASTTAGEVDGGVAAFGGETDDVGEVVESSGPGDDEEAAAADWSPTGD